MSLDNIPSLYDLPSKFPLAADFANFQGAARVLSYKCALSHRVSPQNNADDWREERARIAALKCPEYLYSPGVV